MDFDHPGVLVCVVVDFEDPVSQRIRLGRDRFAGLLGRDPASAKTAAQNVMTFETALAKASRKLEDLRDPVANYNKMTPVTLTSKYTPSAAT